MEWQNSERVESGQALVVELVCKIQGSHLVRIETRHDSWDDTLRLLIFHEWLPGKDEHLIRCATKHSIAEMVDPRKHNAVLTTHGTLRKPVLLSPYPKAR